MTEMSFLAERLSDFKPKEPQTFYPCDEYLNTPEGFYLVQQAKDMVFAGESKFENDHHYCTVFDTKLNKNIVIKFFSPPIRSVSPTNKNLAADCGDLYE
jgi:hypothetical protein